MKTFSVYLMYLALGIYLLIYSPAFADTNPSLEHHFEVGQKVIWLYKNRADSADFRKIPAEVVKLSSKQVKIKVRKNNNEFINRWVNPNKLEIFPEQSFPQIQD